MNLIPPPWRPRSGSKPSLREALINPVQVIAQRKYLGLDLVDVISAITVAKEAKYGLSQTCRNACISCAALSRFP